MSTSRRPLLARFADTVASESTQPRELAVEVTFSRSRRCTCWGSFRDSRTVVLRVAQRRPTIEPSAYGHFVRLLAGTRPIIARRMYSICAMLALRSEGTHLWRSVAAEPGRAS